MIPDGDTNNPNSLLFIMSNLSPRVREALETESYRLTADTDQVTEKYILEDAFNHLLSDLNEIGITVSANYATYSDDIGETSKFLELLGLILPNSLYPLLKTDSKIRNLIESILSGSLGDNDTVIGTYLTELGGLDDGVPLYPHLSDFIDQIYPVLTQTEVFTDYLTNLYSLYKEEVPTPSSDEERHRIYRDHLKKFIGVMSDAVNLFEYHPKYYEITTIQNFVIRDLVSPDNFIDYAYLFNESKASLPEDLHYGYDRKWYHYEVSNSWCFNYYKIRNREKEIIDSQRIMIYAVALARSGLVKSKYDALIKDIKVLYPDDNYHELLSSLLVE